MNIFKKFWHCYWSDVLHWCNGKGATPGWDGKVLHSTCSKCGEKVVQDGQLTWVRDNSTFS